MQEESFRLGNDSSFITENSKISYKKVAQTETI